MITQAERDAHDARREAWLADYWAAYRLSACELRGVPLAVFDFIAHNLGAGAARAALSAVPVRPRRS